MAAHDYKAYDESEVESIRLMLDAEAKEGLQLYFEVKVNGNTRIHKTNKVERFGELYNFINDKTKELVINVFPDPENHNRKEWYKFNFGANNSESLNGLDIEQKLSERMQAFEEKQAAKRTEEKLQEALEQIQQAEDYIRILEEKLEQQKVKPNHFGEWDLGKLASTTIQGIAANHPKVLENVPVLNGIAKVIQEDLRSKPPSLNGTFEGDVSFKAKESKTNASPEAEAHEQTIRQLADFIGEHFDEDQRRMLGWVIVELGENPVQLQTVAELLNIDVKARLAEETEE
ncbi:MAG: hypothetical protein ACJ77K_06430 [Bacteroidia bacterium]